VIGVSTDRFDQMQFWEATFASGVLMLEDPSMRIIGAYGLEDSTLGKEVARPASYVVNPEGRVVWRHLPEDWRLRLDAETYLAVFEEHAP